MKNSGKINHHYDIHSIDSYAVNSALKDVNATLKAFAAVFTLILCIAFDNVMVSIAIIFTMGAFTVIKGKVKFKHYMRFLLIPVSFVLLSSIAIAVNFSDTKLVNECLKIGSFYVCISSKCLFIAVNAGLKALGSISALYMMTLSTPVSELITVLKKLHLPSIFVALMEMIYRFIFILSEQANRMTVSAKSRLGYDGFLRSCCTFGGISGNLFIISLKKAGICYDAMTARCYDGEMSFIEEEKPVKSRQIIIVVFYFLALAFLQAATLKMGGG